ncbi:MAG: branched-chain amino acid ABC transporter permease [Sulfuritalea sp.]|nr:branched-chain amino acid ABC transporter permease [Sulfuritalea sp.]
MSWINILIPGILLGGYYALLASGLSFLFGVMRIINLAHGSLAVLAAYAIWIMADRHEINPFIGVLILLPFMAMLGWALHRLIFERSLKGGALIPILSTFGLAMLIDNLLFQNFGADTRSLAPYVDSLAYDSWELPGNVYVGQLSVIVFVTALLVLGGLHLLLAHTHLGRRIRAAAQDSDAAQLVGIDARRTYAIASAIALMLVALAGLSLALRTTFDPYAGPLQLIFAFEAVVIGGAGSLWGTLLGGVILGVAQSVGAHVHPQGFLIAGHLVFLIILIARLYVLDRLAVGLRRLRGGSQ